MIISALAKKSKRTLSYREKSLKKQAECIETLFIKS